MASRHRKNRQGRILLALLVLACLAGGGAFAWFQYGASSEGVIDREMITATVVSAPFDHVVLEQGEVEWRIAVPSKILKPRIWIARNIVGHGL